MSLFGRKRRAPRRRSRRGAPSAHYLTHKELAREIITTRVAHWNRHYRFTYGRIAIKNQRRCWGSCSAKQNLNFNYRIIFLPESLMDYIIVHELCHLQELNHSVSFWQTVAQALPAYRTHRAHLARITYVPAQGFPSSVASSVRIGS